MDSPFNSDFYRRIFQVIDTPIFVKDRQHLWVFINDKLARSFKLQRESKSIFSDADFFSPEQAEAIREKDELSFSTGLTSDSEEFIKDIDGKERTIVISKSLIELENGQKFLVGTISDITLMSKNGKEFNHTISLLSKTESISHVGGWEVCVASNKLFWSDEVFRIHGLPIGEVPSVEKALSFYPPESRQKIEKALADAENNGECFDVEVPFRTAQGQDIWVRSNGRVVRNGEIVTKIYGAFQDITEYKLSQERLQRTITEFTNVQREREVQTRELKLAHNIAGQASRAKSEFLANMSHEIRTPMNGVLGMAELLGETELTCDQYDMLTSITSSGKALLNIVNDILSFSKIESGVIEAINEPFNLHTLLAGLMPTLSLSAEQKHVKLLLQIATNVPQFLAGDSSRLQQILINLLSNSIKFTDQNGQVLLFVENDGFIAGQQFISFYVADTGIGVDVEAQQRIFTAFEQADSGISRKYGGTGLGLSISARLVALLGGELRLRSVPGVGSVFYFSIPFTAQHAEKDSENSYSVQQELFSGNPLNILIAEDNLVNQKLVRRILERVGHQVVVVDNGRDAVRAAADMQFDLILMDIQMPLMDGEAALKAIRAEQRPYIPIIAVTAHAIEGDRERLLNEGMDGYVSKPINRHNLFSEIKIVIDGYSASNLLKEEELLEITDKIK